MGGIASGCARDTFRSPRIGLFTSDEDVRRQLLEITPLGSSADQVLAYAREEDKRHGQHDPIELPAIELREIPAVRVTNDDSGLPHAEAIGVRLIEYAGVWI